MRTNPKSFLGAAFRRPSIRIVASAILLIHMAVPVSVSGSAWAWSLESGWNHGWNIDSSRKDFHTYRVTKPPFVNVTFPGYDTRTYTFARVSAGDGISMRFQAARSFTNVFPKAHLQLGFGLDVEHQSVRYDLEYWNDYLGFNPFALKGYGPVVQIGAGEVSVDHWSWTPELRLRLEADRSGLRPWIEMSAGYSFLRFDEFDLEPVTYQLAWPVSRGELVPYRLVYGRRNESTFRLGAGIGVTWEFAESWSARIGYHVLFQPGYRLRSSIESDAVIYTYGYSIRDVVYRRLALGVERRW